jgi:hypothetical protein
VPLSGFLWQRYWIFDVLLDIVSYLLTLLGILGKRMFQYANMPVIGTRIQGSSKRRNKTVYRARNGLVHKEKWDGMTMDTMATIKHNGTWQTQHCGRLLKGVWYPIDKGNLAKKESMNSTLTVENNQYCVRSTLKDENLLKILPFAFVKDLGQVDTDGTVVFVFFPNRISQIPFCGHGEARPAFLHGKSSLMKEVLSFGFVCRQWLSGLHGCM